LFLLTLVYGGFDILKRHEFSSVMKHTADDYYGSGTASWRTGVPLIEALGCS